MITGFNFAPRGFALCDGQILPINQNQALFSLLGTTYGGDGRTTFALPDLRGRTPFHVGAPPGGGNLSLGQRGGEEQHTLSVLEIPAHGHQLRASSGAANQTTPVNNSLAVASNTNAYSDQPNATMANTPPNIAVANAGESQGHENRSPYLVVNFVIALQGIFPSRN